jgi:uncharacterized membrane protein YsdA (DUF1294 family)
MRVSSGLVLAWSERRRCGILGVDLSGVFANTRVTFKARDCNRTRPRVGQTVLSCVVDDARGTATEVQLAAYSMWKAMLYRMELWFSLLWTALIVVLLMVGAAMAPSESTWTHWMMSTNAVAFIAFVLDKWNSIAVGGRTPEAVLLALAAVGGSLGALAGIVVARHKWNKLPFMLSLMTIILIQTVLWSR